MAPNLRFTGHQNGTDIGTMEPQHFPREKAKNKAKFDFGANGSSVRGAAQELRFHNPPPFVPGTHCLGTTTPQQLRRKVN